MEGIEYFISGGFGGVCTVLLGHPLDTLKVRLQTMPVPKSGEPPLYAGTVDCFRKIVTKEGFGGLYKGMGAPLAAISPIFALSFLGFDIGKHIFGPADHSQHLTPPQLFASGALAGILTTSIMVPGERIKSLLQIQVSGPKLYNGPIDCMKKLFREGGIASLYRGFGVTLLRDVPASGTYFMTYEAIQNYLTGVEGDPPTFLGAVFAGGCAGITHWLVGMPPDVVKTRIQTAPKGKYPNGVRDVVRKLLAEEGPAAFYTGLAPVMLRAIPANAACFLGFEVSERVLQMLKGWVRQS